MVSEIFRRDDLSVYVVAGVPRSFKDTLTEAVEEATDGSGDVKLVNRELAEWFLAKVRETARESHERTQASAALWRAFRALSAARYHLRYEELEKEVREVRSEIEELWTLVSPLRRSDESTRTIRPIQPTD
jgi:ribosome-binding ATPase YchF (GTP1/OBG family)